MSWRLRLRANSSSTVFVADQSETTRNTLTMLFKLEGYKVAASDRCSELLDSLQLDQPITAVCNWRLCQEEVGLLPTIQRHGMPFVVLLDGGEARTAIAAMKSGTVDVILKPYDTRELLEAVRKAVGIANDARALEDKRRSVLTEREREVLDYLLDGLTSKEIGKILTISHRTVEVHRANILSKYGARNMVSLISIITHK